MPLVNQTPFALHKAAIRNWLSVRSGIDLDKVIWINQITPRPVNPFATMQFTSRGTKIGEDYIQEVQNGNVIERHYLGIRELIVQVEIYTDPTDSDAALGAMELLEQALAALSMRQVIDDFQAADLASMNYEVIRIDDEQVGERWERRAVADVRFSYRTILFDDGTDPAPDDGTFIEIANITANWRTSINIFSKDFSSDFA